MKTMQPGIKSIIFLAFLIIFPVFLFFASPGNAFFKKPWAHLETEYLKEVASSDITYFDGEWKGTLECGSIQGYPGFMQYRKFTIKNGRGVYISPNLTRRQEGYRYFEIEITGTGEVTVKGEYYADFLKKLKFSGQIGIDPQQYYQEVMWLKGSRGPRRCECKFIREVPLVAQKALVDKIPIYTDILRKKAEQEAQRLADELEKRERREAQARLAAQKEEEQKRKEEQARRMAADAAEKKRKKSMALDKAKTLEASFSKITRIYLQHGLQQLGHYRGKVDGAFGPGTRSAIKSYQSKSGKPTTGFLEETDVSTLEALGKVVFDKAEVERKYKEKEARRLTEKKAEQARQKEGARLKAKAKTENERQEAEAGRIAKKEAELKQKQAVAAEQEHQAQEAQRLAAEKAERERKETEAHRLAQEEAQRKQKEAAAAERKYKAEETQRLAAEKAERERKETEAHRLALEEAQRKQKEASAAERKRKAEDARRLAAEKAERERKQAALIKEELRAEIKKQLEVEIEREKRLAARSSKNGDNRYKFVDDGITFKTLSSEVGCHSLDPISVQNEKFARRYKDKLFVLPGRVVKLEGNSALVDLDDGQPDISIDLIPGQDIINLKKELVTIEFIMKKKGGCFSLFKGERGIVYKNRGLSTNELSQN